MNNTKPIEFLGSALDELRAFPVLSRREAGYQLDQVQRGLEPDDWKPMTIIGQGVREIRIRDAAGAFRIIYVAKFADVRNVAVPCNGTSANTAPAPRVNNTSVIGLIPAAS